MTNELTPMQNFETKVKERLIKDIGELIPDEALVELVKKATEDCFFKPQKKVTGTGYNQRETTEPSVFEQTVKALLAERMDKAINLWLSEHSELMAKELKSFVETNAEQAVMKGIASMFTQPFELMQSTIQMNILNNIQNNSGY